MLHGELDLTMNIQKLINQINISTNKFSASFNLVQSHGDYHAGNILVVNDSFWVLDWECSELRSSFFDPFVFLFGTRIHSDFSSSIIQFLIDPDSLDLKEYTKSIQGKVFINNVGFSVFLFLLEEWRFRVGENEIFQFQNLDMGYKPFINNLHKVLQF